jgi:hypothetical protein
MSDFAATGSTPKQLGLGFIKTGQHFCSAFCHALRINNKTEPPRTWGRVAGSAYSVNLYPNPTAPLTPLCPKSPVGKTGRGKISPGAAAAAADAAAAGGCGGGGGRGGSSGGAMCMAKGGAAYCDQKVANREIRVWHFVIEKGLNERQIQNPSLQS